MNHLQLAQVLDYYTKLVMSIHSIVNCRVNLSQLKFITDEKLQNKFNL